jgi:hypothetical protein
VPEGVIWLVKHRSSIPRSWIWKLCAALLVMSVIGIHFIRQRSSTIAGIFENLRTEGLAYKEPFLDFFFFLPIFLCYLVLLLGKNYRKETKVILRFNTEALLFLVFWFGMYLKGYLSNYYYYRNYYVLWLLAWLMCAHAIGLLIRSGQSLFLGAYAFLYGIAVFTSLIGVNAKLAGISSDLFLESKENQTLCPLYAFNREHLKADTAVSTEMYEIYDYILDNLGEEQVPMFTSYFSVMRSAWYEAITDVEHRNNTCDLRSMSVYEIFRLMDENRIEYALVQKNDPTWMKYEPYVLTKLEIVVENEEGMLLKNTAGSWVELLSQCAAAMTDETDILYRFACSADPANPQVLVEDGFEGYTPIVGTALLGENANAYTESVKPKKLKKTLKKLDQDNVDALIIYKESEVYKKNKEYFDSLVIVDENSSIMICGKNGDTWEESY